MRRAAKSRALAAPYEPTPQPADPYKAFADDVVVRMKHGNRPPCDIQVGDRVTLGGLQQFKVTEVYWSEGWQDYFIHGRFGACKFYMRRKDVHRVSD